MCICHLPQLEEYFRRQKYPEEYPTSSTSSPEGEQDDVSDNPLDRTFKSSVTTDDTSDEDFDAGRYSTPQGRKVSTSQCSDFGIFINLILIGVGAKQIVDT